MEAEIEMVEYIVKDKDGDYHDAEQTKAAAITTAKALAETNPDAGPFTVTRQVRFCEDRQQVFSTAYPDVIERDPDYEG